MAAGPTSARQPHGAFDANDPKLASGFDSLTPTGDQILVTLARRRTVMRTGVADVSRTTHDT